MRQAHIYIYIYIYIYIHTYIHTYIASNPTGWAIFRPENYKEHREGRKTRADKGKDKKEEETLKHENPHLLGGGVSWPFLTIKLGILGYFSSKSAHSVGLEPYICIHT